ncbi:dynactin subunit 1-like isoform X2 [Hyla sarda]|uniref:dynactin subunit 1-like isoform X2 n=1 Tax=Hyla sarda TaxID=327740 RepID=UPI0024C37C7C|nr:dynactin subunit 1-like isoform X2 [Hyla sarda]
MQDIIEQRVGALPSQKNHIRKGSGSPEENITTRKIKLQTSFPPIHLSLISNSKPLDRKLKDHASNSDLSREMRGEKINLPQVEKALEKTPKPAKTFLDKSKYSKDFGCTTSNLVNVPTFCFDGQKESRLEKQMWLEIPVPKTTDRLSPEIVKLPECQSCKNEKKIRSDFDKVLVQTKREKEALQLKDALYEGFLFMESCENNFRKQLASSEDYLKLEKSNREKQEKIGCLLRETEELNTKLNTIQNTEKDQEQLLKSEQKKFISDIEDLKSQLEKAKERENLKVFSLEGEKAEILMQLETTKADLERLKKRRSPVIAELLKEKDCYLLEIEKLKAYSEKMKEENLSLSDTIKALQQELDKRSISSCFSPPVYTAGAEVLLISHRNAPEYTHTEATDYKFQEIGTCGRAPPSYKSSSAVEEDNTMKEIYRQMKRERNLLLDVMVIMYERRWFVEEAVPHVRRALRKCGALSFGAD